MHADENGSTVISISASDDADGLDSCPFEITTWPANGSLILDPECSEFAYSPDSNYAGLDQFTIRIADQQGFTNSLLIPVEVLQ